MRKSWANRVAACGLAWPRCRRPVVTAAAGVLVAGATVLAGMGSASAAAAPIEADCAAGANLQTAINDAPAEATLIVTGTCTGAFTIGKNLSLVGQGTAALQSPATGQTTLSVRGSATTVDLASLTVTGGDSSGGGIYNAGTLTLRDSLVGHFNGGGIYNSGTLTLRDSTVTGNTGSGIYNYQPGCCIGEVTLIDSTVSGNTAGYGGGINNYRGTITLRDSTVSGNTAGYGGGINNYLGGLTLMNSTVTGNTASATGGGSLAQGGGIWGFVTLIDSTVSGNTASATVAQGGGIYDPGSGSRVMLRDSTVVDNIPDNCWPIGSIAGCSD